MALTAADLTVKLFADGADKQSMMELYAQPWCKGFTTNPTLMNKAGITDYRAFAADVLADIPDKPISFEVFSDELDEMERQAREIASWGDNVYVKIPITNTKGESTVPLVGRLAAAGVKVNVTAMFTLDQVRDIVAVLDGSPPSCLSVFAGRIADAGVDPVPLMKEALAIMASQPQLELIWASPREVYNIVQAHDVGCHIITVTPALLKKLPNIGKDLAQFSLETVQMFYDDATAAGYTL